MANPEIRVLGLAELRRDLKRLGAQWPKELAKANNRAAEVVAAEARRRAPAGPHQGGGSVTAITQSIRATKAQRSASVSFGGPRSPHAAPTEFGGTLPRHASRSRTTVRQRAFLYPAIAAKTDEVVLTYQAMLERLMDAAFNE